MAAGLLTALLFTGPVAGADDRYLFVPAPALTPESVSTTAKDAQWQSVDGRLSPAAYRRATRQNLRVVYGAIEETITSLGAPRATTRVVGGLVELAVGDPRVGLNRSDTLILQLNDLSSSDRGVSINLEFAW